MMGAFPRKQLALKGAPGERESWLPAPDPHARFHVSSLLPRGKKPYKFPVKRS
jgi:hypothetical protein